MPTLPLPRALRATLFTAAGLATIGGVAAPAASAADVTVPGQCYVYWPSVGQQAIDFSVGGLGANQAVTVELKVKDKLVGGIPSLTADSTGVITGGKIANWTSGLGTGPTKSTKASVSVTDPATGAVLGTKEFKVANVGYKVDGARKRAGTKRVWEISGLASAGEAQGGGKVYYAYYFKGKKQVGKQRLGKSTDACGYIRVKKPLLPFNKRGTFDVRVQASQTWKGDDLPWIGGTVYSYLS